MACDESRPLIIRARDCHGGQCNLTGLVNLAHDGGLGGTIRLVHRIDRLSGLGLGDFLGRHLSQNSIPRLFLDLLAGLAGAAATFWIEGRGLVFAPGFKSGVIFLTALLTLYTFERVLRDEHLTRVDRILTLTAGSLVVLDVFSLVLGLAQFPAATWVETSRIILYPAAMLGLSLWMGWRLLNPQGQSIALSHRAAEAGGSLFTLALVVSLVVISTTLIRNQNGVVINLLLTGLILGSLIAVFVTQVHAPFRTWLKVWVNKHFFRHRFDYRTEWMRVSQALSGIVGEHNPEDIALDELIRATNSQGGRLFVPNNDGFRTVSFTGAGADSMHIPSDHPMIQRMSQQGWIYAVQADKNSAAGQYNDDLQDWFKADDAYWLILPIRSPSQLLGFAALTYNGPVPAFDYESLDMARLCSHQVAGYLQLHQMERESKEQARFAVFTQLSSFLMHDLNNVLNQLSLILHNAPKHKNNPDFVDDMIKTIENSVQRMENLASRLNTTEHDDQQSVALSTVLDNTLRLYSNTGRPPEVSLSANLPSLACDPDKLAMAIGHILKNAQDASGNQSVELTATHDDQMAEIKIQDKGPGMTEDFIQNRLFKPFESTKASGGMGIGVYLTKRYIEQLGGRIRVDSEPGNGTLFSLQLPLKDSSHATS